MRAPYFSIEVERTPHQNNVVSILVFENLEDALAYIEVPDVEESLLFDADGWQLELVVRKGLPPLPFWRFQPSSYRVWDDVYIGENKNFRPDVLRSIIINNSNKYKQLDPKTPLSTLVDLIKKDLEVANKKHKKINL